MFLGRARLLEGALHRTGTAQLLVKPRTLQERGLGQPELPKLSRISPFDMILPTVVMILEQRTVFRFSLLPYQNNQIPKALRCRCRSRESRMRSKDTYGGY